LDVVEVHSQSVYHSQSVENFSGDRITDLDHSMKKSKTDQLEWKQEPVSNTIGSGFGWSSGTESKGAVATTTVAVATEVVGVAEATVSKVGSAPIRETNR